ncbi:MAG: hypothetical protein KGS72_13220 [Cyanobacteria bacterium REEB67]|nr:hypothetical protein [Cyanobacteria bacterium REEB67]
MDQSQSSAVLTVAAATACLIFTTPAWSQGAGADQVQQAKTTQTQTQTQTQTEKVDLSKESDDELDKEELKKAIGKKGSWFNILRHGPSFWKLKYYFAAQNAKDCEFFYGLIQDNPLIGRASIDFNNANGCKCHGVAQVTHYPLKGRAVGQRGYIKVKCEDGRKMHGHFTTTSLTTGFADLEDNLGHKYEGTFGHTAGEAIVKINTLRRELGCPEVTAEDVEMKVNGQVLKLPTKSKPAASEKSAKPEGQ